MLDIRVGLHSFLNRRLERGWGCGVKRELEGDGGEDELDVVAVTKSGTEEARPEETCSATPLRDCLGECRFPCPRLPVEPQDTKLLQDLEHRRRLLVIGEVFLRNSPLVDRSQNFGACRS